MKKVLFLLVTLVLVMSCKGSDSDLKPNAYFSVSETEKVVFSKGNLQYQASTKKWRFAEKPWDYVGEDNKNISSTYSGWIDLFGWNGDMYQVCVDWGDYYGLPTPEGTIGKWRTLTQNEWYYVMFDRTTPSGVRYAKAKVNGVNGIIIVPDEWSTDTYSLNNTDDDRADFDTNVIPVSTWESILEPAGCAFLPAAGSNEDYGDPSYYCEYRDSTDSTDFADSYGSSGNYWSSSLNGDYACYLCFGPDWCFGSTDSQDGNLYLGNSVRLVADKGAAAVKPKARSNAELQRKINNARAQGYVELGFPSGTWWKDKNESGSYTYGEAMEAFGNELPTEEQFKELIYYCEWIWMGNGFKVVGPSGESIFLQAAGYCLNYGVVSVGSDVNNYLLLTPDGSGDAYFLRFYNECCLAEPSYYDFPVRLVALPQK